MVLRREITGWRRAGLDDAVLRPFTHFVDLNRRAKGARVRSIDDLAAGLAYLRDQPGAHTDVVVFSLGTES